MKAIKNNKMKLLVGAMMALAVSLLLVLATASADGPTTTTGLELAPDPPWCFPDCAYIADEFAGAGGEVTYENYADTFTGNVTVMGLHEGHVYQLKLEGIPTCKAGKEGDDASNLAIGYLGRWWNDTDGWNEPSDAAAEASMAAGDCVLGYLLFDCLTYAPDDPAHPEEGMTVIFAADSSYHTCYAGGQPGRPPLGELTMPKGNYKAHLNVTEDVQWWRTILVSHGPLEFTVAPELPARVDIGDPGSEAGHGLTGWGPIEPATHGGQWGGQGPTGRVDNCRVIWSNSEENPDDDPEYKAAYVTLGNPFDLGASLALNMRHLDGIADDSFDVHVKDSSDTWVKVGHYTDWQTGSEEPITAETWLRTSFDLSGVALTDGQPVEVKLVATDGKWSGFNTFGQVAFDWVELVDPSTEAPTAIDLVSFTVEANYGRAMLIWETAAEIDNAGFNLYRAPSPHGPWTQVNDALTGGLIAAQGSPVSGASYSFPDRPGYGTFYYQLEDVDYYGVSTLHGPASVELGSPLRAPRFRPEMPEF